VFYPCSVPKIFGLVQFPKFFGLDTVALSLLFGNYYPIID